MNRRGFLRGFLATVALTTGLARTRLDVVEPDRESDLIALLERKIRATEDAMRAQIAGGLYGGYEVPAEYVPALEKATYEWKEARVVIGIQR